MIEKKNISSGIGDGKGIIKYEFWRQMEEENYAAGLSWPC